MDVVYLHNMLVLGLVHNAQLNVPSPDPAEKNVDSQAISALLHVQKRKIADTSAAAQKRKKQRFREIMTLEAGDRQRLASLKSEQVFHTTNRLYS
jgi:hypothetical protein